MGTCLDTGKFCDGRRKYCHVSGDTYKNLENKYCACYQGIVDGERTEGVKRECFEGATEFGYKVLNQEGLTNWKIEIVEGDEGFCRKATKTIAFGKEALSNFKLMLHEIAHCLTDAFHHSKEFKSTVKRLEETYLKRVKK